MYHCCIFCFIVAFILNCCITVVSMLYRCITLKIIGTSAWFQVSQDRINVDEGGPEKTVKVESTIPIPCTSVFKDDCKLTVVLKGLKNPTGKIIQCQVFYFIKGYKYHFFSLLLVLCICLVLSSCTYVDENTIDNGILAFAWDFCFCFGKTTDSKKSTKKE